MGNKTRAEEQKSRRAEVKLRNNFSLLKTTALTFALLRCCSIFYCVTAFILLFTIHCLLFTDLSFAQEKKSVSKEPTVITSEILTADNKAKTALFEKSVVAKKGEMTLFADKMLVYYSEEKGSSNIKRIDAEGNVKLIKGERVVTSKFATYFAEPEEKIIFTGEPRATEGENVVIGTKMIYFMKDDRSIVENSKVLLIERKGEK